MRKVGGKYEVAHNGIEDDRSPGPVQGAVPFDGHPRLLFGARLVDLHNRSGPPGEEQVPHIVRRQLVAFTLDLDMEDLLLSQREKSRFIHGTHPPWRRRPWQSGTGGCSSGGCSPPKGSSLPAGARAIGPGG